MKLIDRDAITNKDICEYLGRDYTSCAPDIEDLLNEQPTVEAEPVRHGRWIFRSFDEVMNGDWLITNEWVGNGYECSECGRIYEQKKMPHTFCFCPTCGAKMDGKENG